MKSGQSVLEILFLSKTDIETLRLPVSQVVAAVERALVEHAQGTYEMHPKIGVHPIQTHPANFIHAMPAYLKEMGTCGLKWVAGFANNYTLGLPNVTGVQVVNDTSTGAPLAIMDCSHLTGLRTAAVSAIVARICARPGAETLALAGCGFQGGMHLRFLTALIPSLKIARLIDVRAEAMTALKARSADFFTGEVVLAGSNEECLRGADIIATCTNGDEQLIEQAWFEPGAFGVGIEGGCAYTAEALQQADKFVVDDIPLARYFDEIGKKRVTADGRPDPEFPGGLPRIHATIGELLTGKKPGRESDRERIVATPIGMAICDIALGKLAYDRAVEMGVGRRLELM